MTVQRYFKTNEVNKVKVFEDIFREINTSIQQETKIVMESLFRYTKIDCIKYLESFKVKYITERREHTENPTDELVQKQIKKNNRI